MVYEVYEFKVNLDYTVNVSLKKQTQKQQQQVKRFPNWCERAREKKNKRQLLALKMEQKDTSQSL